MVTDEYYMRRALELAKRGRGFTRSNPLVGAVIVRDDRIIGEGFHERYGESHAEVNAIDDALAKNKHDCLSGSAIYVNLEPCFHYGKTPPCVDKIIEHKFSRVVIAMQDPNPLVCGKSIEKLRRHGIAVDLGIMKKEAARLNEVFIHFMRKGKPFICMKSAMSLDGKIATASGDSKWISSEESRKKTAALRYEYQSIMVGVNTIIADNPRLTARIAGKPDPIKIIIDSALRLPTDAIALKNEGDNQTIIYCTKCDGEAGKKKEELSQMHNVVIVETDKKDGMVDMQEAAADIASRGISSILLEGGGTLNFTMIREGLLNKGIFVIAPMIIGGENAKTPVMGEGYAEISDARILKEMSFERVGQDLFVSAYF